MKYIIDAIAFIVGWLLKKKALSLAKLPVKIAISGFVGMSLTLFISAFILFANFLLTLLNDLYDLLNQVNNASPADGEAYGISLSTIWNAFLGFMSASGLGHAIYLSLNLFLSLLFSYYAVKIAMLVGFAFKETAKLLTNTATMIES